jgi:Uma2 family endonuclease
MAESSQIESVWEVPDRLRLELLARLSTKATRPARMSYEEFLEWADEDTLAEWVDGEVVMTSPATSVHEESVSFLDQVLSTYVRVHDLGAIRIAPFQMKLPGSSGREPDVMYVNREHLGGITRAYLDGPADAAIEVTSRESERRDRGDKFYEYAEAGVPEYWLLDPERRDAAFFHLDANGNYQAALTGTSGVYRSKMLDLEWLWREPLPDPNSLLLEIAPETYSTYLEAALRRAGR